MEIGIGGDRSVNHRSREMVTIDDDEKWLMFMGLEWEIGSKGKGIERKMNRRETIHDNPTRIFFYEALAVVSALSFAASFNRFQRVIIFTDNSNTVSMFNSLHAKPDYNPLLITAMNILLDANMHLRVLHIPGSNNNIADAISRNKFEVVKSEARGATLHFFTPPELSSGSNSI
ncbi:hypothetical protein D9758_018374 [Tetrapyrgos nigripes]|uniref:Uncharacterized protein n=1 Tax=Tetrapyrgos nigripes TaxID=182062 RepID=A0A8H5BB69_9AGAR|nr:hypothetical protein D9758_018374 [Tetrapyrgos nigripes]